jgi:hypothetical protein
MLRPFMALPMDRNNLVGQTLQKNQTNTGIKNKEFIVY